MTTDDTAGAPDAVATDGRALPPPAPKRPVSTEWTMSVAIGIMQLAGLASIGAGAIHAGVAGLHAEQTTLARLFVLVAVAQIGVGLLALCKGGRLAAIATALVNLGAVTAWAASLLWGIGWINGLETAEDPRFTDTACAVLGAIAIVAAVVALVRRRTAVSSVRLGVPALAVGLVTLAAMLLGTEHTHSHDEAEAVASGAGAPVAAAPAASPASRPSSSCGRRRSSRTRCASCRRSPTSTRSTSSATARSATNAPATSTTSTTR